MRRDAAGWLIDVAEAAEELGYWIVKVERDSITLIPRIGDGQSTVEIESKFMGGEYLRQTLKARVP